MSFFSGKPKSAALILIFFASGFPVNYHGQFCACLESERYLL